MTDHIASPDFIRLTADITSAFVGNNHLTVAELPALITSIHTALEQAVKGPTDKPVESLTPAVPVKKSVTQDFIICLEDGKKFKSLKRHLRTSYNMTPEQYRSKWGLPADYPVVAPNYAKTRSELAKTMGLGQQRRKEAVKAAASATPTWTGKRRRGKKAA
jgi:predicted transcriptional regulator